jgi:hypothetical protein
MLTACLNQRLSAVDKVLPVIPVPGAIYDTGATRTRIAITTMLSLQFFAFVLLLFHSLTISCAFPLTGATRQYCNLRIATCCFSTAASNVFDVAVTLEAKGLKNKVVERNAPREFSKVWESFQAEFCFGNEQQKLISADDALEKLKAPFTNKYNSEAEFDSALFDALRDRLGASVFQQNETNLLVLKIGKTEQYAVGFSRQKAVAGNLKPTKDEGYISANSRSLAMTSQSTPTDHNVCLFQKRSNKWTVLDCFSIVELKLSDTTCDDFEMTAGEVLGVDFFEKHSALGQTILYNLDGVLLYHARRGVLEDHLPLAMVAGKKERNETSDGVEDVKQKKTKLRWVSGSLDVPRACGGQFLYSVTGFGTFENNKEKEKLSVTQAVSVYLETLLFGLIIAKTVQNNLVNGGTLQPGVPASGRSLMIGDSILNLSFCSSPITGANGVWRESNSRGWKTSQGELFQGRLTVGDIFCESNDISTLCFYDKEVANEEANVVVKVSSITVHKLLIRPKDAFRALDVIHRKSNYDLLKEVQSVLKAVVETDAGMVTVMKDLSKQGYEMLQPRLHRDHLSVLWIAFEELVEKVLLPFANLGIIHPDIRPGYDITSNILCKVEGNQGRIECATMQLIDYESLVQCNAWSDPPNGDDRYISREVEWDAVTFVWWQCLGVAYSWKERIIAKQLRQKGMTYLKGLVRKREEGPEWLRKFHGFRGKVELDDVKNLLRELAKEFV